MAIIQRKITTKYLLGFTTCFIFIISGFVIAQDTPSAQPTLPPVDSTATQDETPNETDDSSSELTSGLCPSLVQDGFTATELVCPDLIDGEICVGNGLVVSAPESANSFAQPGDRVVLTTLDEIQLQTSTTPDNVWTVLSASAIFDNTAGTFALGSQMLIFGDVTIADATDSEDEVTSFQTGTVLVAGGMNVRREPSTAGTIIWQLTNNEEVVVTGRSPDQVWYRIEIPSTFGGAGWVYYQYMQVELPEQLPFATIDSPVPELIGPEYKKMQSFDLISATTDDTCSETPDSGVMIQSPDGQPNDLKLRVNNVVLTFNGTIFLKAQAGNSLQIDVLEGQASASVLESNATAQVGSRIEVSLDANLMPLSPPTTIEFDSEELIGLPTRLFARQFVIGGAVTSENNDIADPTVCTLDAGESDSNIRQGPSTDYITTAILDANTSVTAFAQTRDSAGFVWYETPNGFIRFDTVTESDACTSLPAADLSTLPPPEPTTESAAEADLAPPDSTNSLISELLGEVCGNGNIQTSFNATSSEALAYAVGGNWIATANTTATFAVQGAVARGEYGDVIRLIDSNGGIISGSETSESLTVTFDSDVTFTTNISASRDNFVILTVTCP